MALARLQHLLTSYNHLSAASTHTHYSGVRQPLFLYKSCLGKVSELKCAALSGEPLDPLKNWPSPNNRLKRLPPALITVELSI